MATTKPTTKKTPTKALAKKSAATKAVVKVEKAPTAIVKPAKATKAVVVKPDAPSALVTKFQTHKEDTGSTEVQIAIMTDQMDEVTKHLKLHPKDHDARRGLLIMVGKRRRLLNYLARSNDATYKKFVAELKLRK